MLPFSSRALREHRKSSASIPSSVLRARRHLAAPCPLPLVSSESRNRPRHSPAHIYLQAGFNGGGFSLKESLHDFTV